MSTSQGHLDDLIPEPEALAAIPARLALHHHLLPLSLQDGVLTVAVVRGHDVEALDEVASRAGCRVLPRVTEEHHLDEAIHRAYGVGARAIAERPPTSRIESAGSDDQVQDLESDVEDAAVIRFVNEMLVDAVKRRATDVHLEPYRDALRIRYRIDGVLYEIATPADIFSHRAAVISRIKVLAALDIAEHRLPQDGRIKVRIGDREFDIRISTLPTPFGEAVNVRLLAAQGTLRELSELGLAERQLAELERVLRKPHGVVLVTGPTGSGKTTTLYACLQRLNTSSRKIITIEDPIEYQIAGVTQIQVRPQVGLTFARGLRSMLRHDPDIMMVGEIRDRETAEVAVQVAMTGHLVFSTVHTNDAASTATRLMDMGIEPYLISSSVECFIAQRLVRVVCAQCVGRRMLTAEETHQLDRLMQEARATRGSAGWSAPRGEIPAATGCDACGHTGYRGRTALYEILPVDDALRALVLERAPAPAIVRAARAAGVASLFENGFAKIAAGVTTLEEVCRVTQVDAVFGDVD